MQHYFSITLPHVVLLHSVTSLQYKGSDLVESDLHLVFASNPITISLLYHYPEHLMPSWGKLLTLYSLHSTLQSTMTFPLYSTL